MRRKDWCWSVRAVYVLGKLSDVSGPGLEEAGRYRMVSKKFLEFLRDGLPEKKLQLVGTSILLILLSPKPGCYK